jgi:hypothetical protein
MIRHVDIFFISLQNYDEILTSITGQGDTVGAAFFKHSMKLILGARSVAAGALGLGSPTAVAPSQAQQLPRDGDMMTETYKPFARDVLTSARLRPNNTSAPRILSTRMASMEATQGSAGTRVASVGRNTEINITEGTARSGEAWGYNTFLQLPIDELLEKCEELIKSMDSNKPQVFSEHQSTSGRVPNIGHNMAKVRVTPTKGNLENKRGSLQVARAASPRDLSGAALMKIALYSSYGIDTMLYNSKNGSSLSPMSSSAFLDLQSLGSNKFDRSSSLTTAIHRLFKHEYILIF